MEQGTGLLKRELLALKIWRRSPIGRRRRTQNSYSVDSNSTGATICGCSIKEVYQFSKLMVRYRNSSSAPKGCLALSQKETIQKVRINFPLPIYEGNGVLSGGDKQNQRWKSSKNFPLVSGANSQTMESILCEFEAFSVRLPDRQSRLTIYSLVA